MFVWNSALFLTDKNDRSGQPSEQSGCSSGDDRTYVGINHSSRDVCTNRKFNTIIPYYKSFLFCESWKNRNNLFLFRRKKLQKDDSVNLECIQYLMCGCCR